MNIIPDSNIWIADPWFQSQRMRVLFDYVEKTSSQILLLEPVEMEIRAHISRSFEAAVQQLDKAIKIAERRGISVVPTFNAETALEETLSKWESVLNKVVKQNNIKRLGLDNSLFPEALRRATERIPPCNDSGKEMRDTIIWLHLLSACRGYEYNRSFAFISANTSDFASNDGSSLRPELKQEIEDDKFSLLYYSSLDAFIKEYGGRFTHITPEWVEERVDEVELINMAADYVSSSWRIQFRISDSEYKDYYEPKELSEITQIDLDITGPIYVYDFDDSRVEISIGAGVYIEADFECRQVSLPPSYTYQDEYDYWEEDFPKVKTLGCYAELWADFSATVKGDKLEIIKLEDMGEL